MPPLPRAFSRLSWFVSLSGIALMSGSASAATAPFGSWKSPITSAAIVSDSIRLGQVAIEGDTTYWLEGRPKEAGRNVLVRLDADGSLQDVTPAQYNVRTRVHEYGGGSFIVAAGIVYFSNFADQGLYLQPPNGPPQHFRTDDGVRFADAAIDAARSRLITVREDHSGDGHEPVNTLVSISLEGTHAVRTLASGADFYSTPRLSPDGRKLAWLSWNHPNMPWDGTDLWLADIKEDGSLDTPQHVAGGQEESIFQPSWSPSGELVFVSDRSGWWNLYSLKAGLKNGAVKALHSMKADFGEPQWEFAMSRYGFLPDGRIVTSYIRGGDAVLAILDPETGRLQNIKTPYREIKELRIGKDFAVFLGGSGTESRSVVRLDLKTGHSKVLRQGSKLALDPGYLSIARPIEFPTTGGATAHAFFYAARNKDYSGPVGERAPLLVLSHGGPTSQTTATFNPTIQYFTSRGIGVVDVNYGGSSGYGRAYRRRLNGNWGIVDVDDCVNAAKYLVSQGLADENRLAIRGGSAGGYTTLAALTFRRVFKAGASYYGVGDLEVLARDTHKFESRYLDSLIGPYPEQKALYESRSPINSTDQLSSALILFQGLEDKVVPPNQSESMFEAVKKKGLPVAYLPFAGEQHGFRAAATIRRSLEAEFYFYGKVFGFTPADTIEPVAIENLPGE